MSNLKDEIKKNKQEIWFFQDHDDLPPPDYTEFYKESIPGVVGEVAELPEECLSEEEEDELYGVLSEDENEGGLQKEVCKCFFFCVCDESDEENVGSTSV
jgi:hypothetical protein